MHTQPVRSPLRFYDRRGRFPSSYRAPRRSSRGLQHFRDAVTVDASARLLTTYPSPPPSRTHAARSPIWRDHARRAPARYNSMSRPMQQTALAFNAAEDFIRGVSPLRELGAYEWLWAQPGATFKTLANKFRADKRPSDFVPADIADATAAEVRDVLAAHGVSHFGVQLRQSYEYPQVLRDGRHPLELLYFLGTWNFIESDAVAVVGTRKASSDALAETDALVRALVADDWSIVSGLADGIDTQAHTSALDASGRTIAVIGTPISETYPRANAELHARIARDFLVVSQVPVLRYYRQTWMQNRAFFRERNVTMAALTRASIIVEAGEMSGARILARAAVEQGRPLFILDRCFRDPAARWPHAFVEQHGAIRIRDHAEMLEALRGVHRDR
jgi:DNA processing protein